MVLAFAAIALSLVEIEVNIAPGKFKVKIETASERPVGGFAAKRNSTQKRRQLRCTQWSLRRRRATTVADTVVLDWTLVHFLGV